MPRMLYDSGHVYTPENLDATLPPRGGMSRQVKRLITGVLVGTLMVGLILFSTALAPTRPAPVPATDPLLLAYRAALAHCRERATALGFASSPDLAASETRFVDTCATAAMKKAGYFR